MHINNTWQHVGHASTHLHRNNVHVLTKVKSRSIQKNFRHLPSIAVNGPVVSLSSSFLCQARRSSCVSVAIAGHPGQVLQGDWQLQQTQLMRDTSGTPLSVIRHHDGGHPTMLNALSPQPYCFPSTCFPLLRTKFVCVSVSFLIYVASEKIKINIWVVTWACLGF